MPDDPMSAGVPATESADEAPAAAPVPGGGFLLDEQPEQPLDGEQLFRHAVAPPPALPPAPQAASAAQASSGASAPSSIDTVTLCRILGVGAVVLGLLAFNSTRDLPLPLVLVIGGLLLAFYIGSPNRLRRDQIIDRWELLIDGATGRREDVMQGAVARIDAQPLPQVRHELRELAASLLRSGTRPFLVVTHQGNRRLTPYRMHGSVRDYGTSLQTNWYLSYHRGFFEKLKPNPLVALNLFEEQDLRAYVTTVHHCFLEAVIELMTTLGKDASTIERSSKGFLGIS